MMTIKHREGGMNFEIDIDPEIVRPNPICGEEQAPIARTFDTLALRLLDCEGGILTTWGEDQAPLVVAEMGAVGFWNSVQRAIAEEWKDGHDGMEVGV